MSQHTQTRIMRTYRVELAPIEGDSPPVEAEVNLSYEVDDLDAVDSNGQVVEPLSLQAKIEAIRRLRKLAETQRTRVSVADIDRSDFDVQLLRQRFVTVELDENGRPIPRYTR